MATTTKAPAAGLAIAQAVTAHQPFCMGGFPELFAVQSGVPLSNALQTLSLLIGAAGASVADIALTIGEGDKPDAPWAIAHVLDAASALTASIQAGFDQACDASGSASIGATNARG